MRVLYDHQVFSLQDAGGASRYFYELARYMGRIPDVQTEVLMGINGNVYPFRELDAKRTRVAELSNWLRPGSLRYAVNEVWSNVKAASLGKFDVYHPTTYLKMPLARAHRVIATHMECTQERFPELVPHARRVINFRKWLFPRVDAIICISESTRDDLLHFYDVDRAKTRVIYDAFSPLPRDAKAAAAIRQKMRRDYVLYVGKRATFKNFRGLLQAMHDAKLADFVDLLVLGGGEFTPEERTLIQSLGLGNSVVSVAKVSDEFLAEAYAAARLLCIPL